MGMASFGEPRYVDEVYKLIQVGSDGSFELNMDYLSFHYSASKTFNRRFIDLFGAPRDPQSHFCTAGGGYPAYFWRKAG